MLLIHAGCNEWICSRYQIKVLKFSKNGFFVSYPAIKLNKQGNHCQKQPPEVFYKKGVFRNFAKFNKEKNPKCNTSKDHTDWNSKKQLPSYTITLNYS